MRNLIPVLMLVMSVPAMAFVPGKADCNDLFTGRWNVDTIVEGPDKIYKQYEAKIRDRIQSCRNVIDTTISLTKKKDMEETIKLLDEIIAGINDLKKSLVIYTAIYTDKLDSTRGSTAMDSTGRIISTLGKSSKIEEVVGHEIRHQVQYEWQEISFLNLQPSELSSKNGKGKYGALHDITDETDAIKMGRLLKANASENKRIKDRRTRRQRKEYCKLPPCPINIGSREGKELRKKVLAARVENHSPSDFYNGWEIDYKKLTPPPHP